MIPVDQMTDEDFARTFPDWSITPESPSLYPSYEKTPGLSKEDRIEVIKKEYH